MNWRIIDSTIAPEYVTFKIETGSSLMPEMNIQLTIGGDNRSWAGVAVLFVNPRCGFTILTEDAFVPDNTS